MAPTELVHRELAHRPLARARATENEHDVGRETRIVLVHGDLGRRRDTFGWGGRRKERVSECVCVRENCEYMCVR